MTVSPTEDRDTTEALSPAVRKREVMLFLLLAVVVWPFIAVGVVGGWGFVVWMYQLIAGPPGPPA